MKIWGEWGEWDENLKQSRSPTDQSTDQAGHLGQNGGADYQHDGQCQGNVLVEQILMELSVLNFNLVLGPVEGVAELIHLVGDERAACYFATDQLANELKIVSKSKTNRILPISTSLMLHLDSHSGALFLDRRIRFRSPLKSFEVV